MTERPTTIERAFALAASGRVNTVVEIRQALRQEGYIEEGHLHGGSIVRQLTRAIADANARLKKPGKPAPRST